ncbi:asparagine synthase (glutamine-hydrolyzing) [Halobacteriovorax sp. JY17]|uniref:asparagine synthase (glutamine-hydrolyzing) n=1 Tax=Halobacteriovorax sp. JY17 TaxID=2014617 RepID=UPI000C4633D6|nr:asparagine synthase (glutamine-hydrolyzing) [Halobacteriovorax sp. JY17]PIK14672.1 MAG: asparagine synthase (glutamine-hydrolyzing) [Halobacteriovorax sp. JY17]
MCGILGVVELEKRDKFLSPETFIKMNDTMIHRGPDGEGFYFSTDLNFEEISRKLSSRSNIVTHFSPPKHRRIYLAHRRLSILDLDLAAGQPMTNSEKNIFITFNGEIYNHQEIRDELISDGFIFRTDHSDTEAALYAYEKWGIDFVKKLRGMFAIVIWDERNDRILMVRDRTGIKPLYYSVSNNKLYFASEMKAIFQDTEVPKKLNKKGLYDYLSFLTVPAPETLFKNVYKIPAGHMLIVEKGRVQPLKEYWDVFDNWQDLSGQSEERIRENLIAELKESVSLHMAADVPIGVFLSGGVDSSLNAKLFSQLSPDKVKCFSVGYKDDDKLTTYKNEFEYARLMANTIGADYHEKELTQDMFIDFIPQLIHHQDEPIADPVCFPVFEVSKLAKDSGVTVCQVGEGSDELFWGYESWKTFKRLHDLNKVPMTWPFKKALLEGSKLAGKTGKQFEFLRRGVEKEPIFWSGAEAFTEAEKRKLLNSEFLKDFKGYSSYEVISDFKKKFDERCPDPSFLNWMAYSDLKLRLPELLLMRVDKMGMAVSLEARVPFLDYKFVEYALSVPTALRCKDNVSKYILKKAVEPLLPHEIIYRKKQGFGAPVHDWFMDRLGGYAKDKLISKSSSEFFDQNEIRNKFAKGDNTNLWYLLNFQEWKNQNL